MAYTKAFSAAAPAPARASRIARSARHPLTPEGRGVSD
jgi:hypothetical protein